MKKVALTTKYSAQLFFLILAVFLFGCSATKPIRLEELEVPLPDNWAAAIPDSKPFTGKWWEVFADTTLETVIQDIRANSPDLKSILHRQQMALQNARISGAGVFPSVGAGASGSKSQQNLAGFGFADAFLNMGSGSDSSSGGGQQTNQVLSFDTETYGLNFNFQWELDIWGRALNGRRALFKDYEAANYELSYLGFSTLVRAAQTYFQNVEASGQVAIAEQSYASLVEIRDLVQDRYNRGLKSSLDYRLAETSVATARVLIENRHNQLKNLNRRLEILLGKYPSGTFITAAEFPESLPMVPAGIPANLLSRRPDIRALFKKVEAADLRVGQAKRNLLPGITLTGSAGTSTKDLKEIFNDDNGIWNLGLNAAAPLFNGGRLRSAVKLQEAVLEQSKQELVRGLLTSFSEVEQLLDLENSLLVQLDALNNAVQQSQDAYNLSKERYDKGVTTLESVLNSQRQYNDLRSQYLTLKRQRIENRLSLILALGGAYEPADTQMLN